MRAYDRDVFAAATGRLTAALPAGALVADAPYFMHGRWERDAQQAATRPCAHRSPGAMLTQFAADWFHPNDRGHRVWADAFWQEIQRAGVALARS